MWVFDVQIVLLGKLLLVVFSLVVLQMFFHAYMQ